MSWTCQSIPFIWLRREEAGAVINPTWQRDPRDVVRPYLGLGDADIAQIGYQPYVISGAIGVASAAHAAALRARHGQLVTISDSTTTWTAYAKITVSEIVNGDGWYVGEASFTRPRA